MSGIFMFVEQVYIVNDFYIVGDEYLEVCKFNVDRSLFGELFGELLFMQVDNLSGLVYWNVSFFIRVGLLVVKLKF